MNTLIKNIIKQLEEIQDGKNWINQSFNKKLKNLPEEEVFIRPNKSLHTIAELIAHLTAWRNETILKIKTGEGKLTDGSNENWVKNKELKSIGWINILNEYWASQKELIELIQDKDDSFLTEGIYYDTDFKANFNYLFAIEGMIHHDLYHLGQVGIVIKFIEELKVP